MSVPPMSATMHMPVPCIIRRRLRNGRVAIQIERLRYVPVATGAIGNPFVHDRSITR